MRYAAGALVALLSAVAINLGFLVQKRAVAAAAPGASALGTLAKNRTWLLGLGLQVAIGAPLNMLAIGLIGPALVPGIMALGLVVLALGSARITGEELGRRDHVGIGLVLVAVAALAASRLSVDIFARAPTEPDLLVRSASMALSMSALALACQILALRGRTNGGARAILFALASGAWLALSNLALGVLQASAAAGAKAGLLNASVLGLSLIAVAVANLKALALTQRAFVSGAASTVIPVQQVPAQLFPLAVFFLVYRPFVPSPLALALAGSGAVLVLSGAYLLGSAGSQSREPRNR